jgi:hypothetical protein
VHYFGANFKVLLFEWGFTSACFTFLADVNGWETSFSGRFESASSLHRKFDANDRFWRRRWMRTRVFQHSPQRAAAAAAAAHAGVRFQHLRGSDQDMVVKVGDSHWSEPLDLAGPGGALALVGSRWRVRGFQGKPVAPAPSFLTAEAAVPPLSMGPGRPKAAPAAAEASGTPAAGSAEGGAAQGGSAQGGGAAAGAHRARSAARRADAPVPSFELVYELSKAPPPWHRTTVVTIRDRIMVTNGGKAAIRVKQIGAPDSTALTIDPDTRCRGERSKPAILYRCCCNRACF